MKIIIQAIHNAGEIGKFITFEDSSIVKSRIVNVDSKCLLIMITVFALYFLRNTCVIWTLYTPAKDVCGGGKLYFTEIRAIKHPVIIERMESAAISLPTSQVPSNVP